MAVHVAICVPFKNTASPMLPLPPSPPGGPSPVAQVELSVYVPAVVTFTVKSNQSPFCTAPIEKSVVVADGKGVPSSAALVSYQTFMHGWPATFGMHCPVHDSVAVCPSMRYPAPPFAM